MAQSTSRSRQQSRSRGGSSSSNGASSVKRHVENAGEAVTSAAGKATSAAGKAKGPALAGGAAVAGLVGGAALASRARKRRVLGVPVPGTRRALIQVKRPGRNKSARNFAKAAGQMAELATEVKLAREQLDGNNKVRRSPVEVVLDGLTARRPR